MAFKSIINVVGRWPNGLFKANIISQLLIGTYLIIIGLQSNFCIFLLRIYVWDNTVSTYFKSLIIQKYLHGCNKLN